VSGSTPTIHEWFEGVGFVELALESVGAHRWPREAVPLELGQRLFTCFREKALVWPTRALAQASTCSNREILLACSSGRRVRQRN
jgi:hypothetical protein